MTVPTIEGSDEVEIPAGTQHGDVEVLKGEGLPPLQGKGRGDLHVAFELVVPADLSDEQLELVRRLDGTLSEPESAASRRRQ
jgi:molecular chaperone DnaJ